VQNVFDRDPPYLADQGVNVGYDPPNANPFGRTLSLTVTKSW
jgi:outer membrane receptor protein involved in Fe transport